MNVAAAQTSLPVKLPLDPREIAALDLGPRQRGEAWNQLDLCPLQRGCIEQGIRLVLAGSYPTERKGKSRAMRTP